MTYKETLFFIGKCLTISHEENNKKIVTESIKNNLVNWDSVVKLSTAHYVFPALYCNLKRANLLAYLPKELVNYMIYITDLNRERNQQIIVQAKELNEVLSKYHITPIYIKGTGFLLEGLYEDIAERMVGDIDFLFSEKDFEKAIAILLKNGYEKVDKTTYEYPNFKHYPRLCKEGSVAAIEIHKQLIVETYTEEFNYEIVSKSTVTIDTFKVLSAPHQLALCIIAKQINDKGYYYKNMALRNGYDVFLVAQKTSAKNAVNNFKKLSHPLNCFLASCYKVFGEIEVLQYTETDKTKQYLTFFERQLINNSLRKKHHKRIKLGLFLKSRFLIIFKTIYRKKYRIWFLKRITDKQWWKEKFLQIGFKPSS